MIHDREGINYRKLKKTNVGSAFNHDQGHEAIRFQKSKQSGIDNLLENTSESGENRDIVSKSLKKTKRTKQRKDKHRYMNQSKGN